MNKTKKWLLGFVASVLIIATVMGCAVFIIDPFFQYRVREDTYKLSELYNSPGLVKNYEYDTLLLGSSMIQNTDMDYFEETLNTKALKIGIGGVNLDESGRYLLLAYDRENVNDFYVSIDFASVDDEGTRTPLYLFGDDIISRLKYFFSYEAWLRFIPLDIAFVMAEKTIGLPESMKEETKIKRVGEWVGQATFGKEKVIDNYTNDRYSVSAVDKADLENKMKTNIDKFFDVVDTKKGNHIFFFPPYSSLYWCETQEKDYFEEYMDVKKYFCEKAWATGATVYDFQSADFTRDLDNYKDTTHYKVDINNWMTECFAKKENIITKENFAEYEQKLRSNTDSFRSEHTFLFK